MLYRCAIVAHCLLMFAIVALCCSLCALGWFLLFVVDHSCHWLCVVVLCDPTIVIAVRLLFSCHGCSVLLHLWYVFVVVVLCCWVVAIVVIC